MFVKPANLGSSVGISKAKDAADAARGDGRWPAASTARSWSRRPCRDAREIECAVLGNDDPEASVPGEVVPSREFYDYEAKYLDDGSKVDHPGGSDRCRPPSEIRAAVDRGVQGDRRRRHGARRFPARARRRHDLRQRGQHHPGLHHDQHVSRSSGRRRASRTRRYRSPDRSSRSSAHAEKQQLRTSMT